jgi:hypothetical protein
MLRGCMGMKGRCDHAKSAKLCVAVVKESDGGALLEWRDVEDWDFS